MKALFIYAEFPDTYWSFIQALKFLGKGRRILLSD